MKKLIILLCLILASSKILTVEPPQPARETVRDIIESCLSDEVLIKRYEETIKKYSDQYNIDPLILARRIRTESRFNPFAKGDYVDGKYESFGPMQIKTKYFSHLLYRVDNGELGKYLKEREKKGLSINYERYMCRIAYGVESGCIIISNYLSKYGGCYIKAIGAYGYGSSHPIFKKILRDLK
jgi:hypothetical protein